MAVRLGIALCQTRGESRAWPIVSHDGGGGRIRQTTLPSSRGRVGYKVTTPGISIRIAFIVVTDSGGCAIGRESILGHPLRDGSAPSQPRSYGFWLYGDGKGCQTRIRFADTTGQTFQPDGPKIDWKGWRYVSFPLESHASKALSHWGGANDGTVHYPVKWDAAFLLDNTSRLPIEGEIYLSAPTLIY